MDLVKVRAPASIANVVCGFDVLGFALDAPFDDVILRRIDERKIRIIHRDDFGLPTDPQENVAGVALQAVLDRSATDMGFEIEINKKIKPGSGIGSSAASACAAAVAANHLLGERFSKLEIIEFAMEGERLASGAKHADNVAPCIYGGFTLVRSVDPLDVVEINFPPLFVTVIHPQIEIRTSEAREILPKAIILKDAVRQWANVGSLVAGLAKGDQALIARSLEDYIIEPVRKSLIPMFDEVKAASLAAGAIGGGISGSGPSIFMLSVSEENAEAVAKAMEDVYSGTRIDYRTYVSSIASKGVQIVDG
jgi:homoserine kinase